MKISKFAALAAALMLLLCACGKAPAQAKPFESAPEKQTEETPAPEKAKLEITDYCSEKGKYTDGVGNNYDYSFVLPKLTGADTEYVRAVNDEIAQIYDEQVKLSLDTMQKDFSLVNLETGYETGEKDGVVSVMAYLLNDWDCDIYWCWNLTEYGEEVTNKELLESFGLSEEDFEKRAYELMEQKVAFSDSIIASVGAEQANSVRERTLSEENCNSSMPMFIGADGKLRFVGRLYSLAGADFYDRVFEF